MCWHGIISENIKLLWREASSKTGETVTSGRLVIVRYRTTPYVENCHTANYVTGLYHYLDMCVYGVNFVAGYVSFLQNRDIAILKPW